MLFMYHTRSRIRVKQVISCFLNIQTTDEVNVFPKMLLQRFKKRFLIVKNGLFFKVQSEKPTLNRPYCTSKAARVMFSMKSLKIPPPSMPASSTPNSLTNDTRICKQTVENNRSLRNKKGNRKIVIFFIKRKQFSITEMTDISAKKTLKSV